VMAAAQALRNVARWTVAMAVGLRQSEALALRWADVDLEQERSRFAVGSTGSADRASSTRSPRPIAAAAPSRCRDR
jgi:integrase